MAVPSARLGGNCSMPANSNAWLPDQHRMRAVGLPRWRACNVDGGSDGSQLDDKVLQERRRCASEETRHKSLQSKLSLAADFARRDATVISRGLLCLDERARGDVARLQSTFRRLDARAKEDAVTLDARARSDVRRLRLIALGLEEIAKVELQRSVAHHWLDGALAADLEQGKLRLRRRLLEDSYSTVQAFKNLHDSFVMVVRPRGTKLLAGCSGTAGAARQEDSESPSLLQQIRERGTKKEYERTAALQELYSFLRQQPLPMPEQLNSKSREVSADRGSSSSSEIDRRDLGGQRGGSVLWVGEDSVDELEFLLSALLDMDGISSAYGASLLATAVQSNSCAVRFAVVTALSHAPSLSSLGNVGLGALQRLSIDHDSAVALEAKAVLAALQKQWEDEAASGLSSAWSRFKSTRDSSNTNTHSGEDNNDD